MYFITNLPLYSDFSGIYACIDKLTKFFKIVPVTIGEGALPFFEVVQLFLNHVVYFFGIS